MNKKISDRINCLEKVKTDYAFLIAQYNSEIEEGELFPNELQKAQIKFIAQIGKDAIDEIDRLKQLSNRNQKTHLS